MSKIVKALVITGYGVNCEEEMSWAYKLAGAESKIVHINEILMKGLSIQDFDVVNFPGGFSFGDDIASGRVLANKIRFKKLSSGKTLLEELKVFIESGKYVLGVCNGFQLLLKSGLLPYPESNLSQVTTLMRNDSGKFEDRWVYCKVGKTMKTPFLKDIDVIRLPVRHGEGKFLTQNENVKKDLINNGLNCLSYCDENGNITDSYPLNPNGSELSVAGICSNDGHVFGLMPHPEAYLSIYNNPDFPRLKRINPEIGEDGEGLKIFKNIVNHIKNHEFTQKRCKMC